MNTIPHRVVIYPKDVMNITGLSERTSRTLLTRVRKKLNKDKGAFITIDEFCTFTGIKPELVATFLI